jgi:IS1 family transposase
MNRLNIEERAKILGCLVEGNSIRATARLTDTDKKTVLRLLADVGAACADYHDKHVRNIVTKRIQCDEIWSFCYSKEANVPAELKGNFGFGDVWTWTALDSDTKLIVQYAVDRRDVDAARTFMHNLVRRLAVRVQLTTDGHKPYLVAVKEAFGDQIDYGQLIKIYTDPMGGQQERRYSGGVCCGAEKRRKIGLPSRHAISTSHVERSNLTMRMSMRRFTRLTNGFSKKVANLHHAVALHFMYYNFCRAHQTLKGITPAMAARMTDRPWSLEDIAGLVQTSAHETDTLTA